MAITKNSAQCKHCKEILVSRYGHDWVCCSCWDKEDDEEPHGIFIDGGYGYMRYGYKNESEFINLTTYSEDE